MTTSQAQFHLERWQEERVTCEAIIANPDSTEESRQMARERIVDADYFINRYQDFLNTQKETLAAN